MQRMKFWQVLLIISAIMVPLLIFGGAAWERRLNAFREGDAEVARVLSQVTENMHFVFTSEWRTVLDILDHLKDESWEKIAQPATSAYLHTMVSIRTDGIEAIWIADPDGYIRASSEPFASNVRVPEQGFFAAKGRSPAVFLSTTLQGQPPMVASIVAVGSRYTADGRFNGTVHVALDVGYFMHILDDAVGASQAMLLRNDGEVLVSHTTSPTYYLSPSVMKQIDQPSGQFVDQQTMYSYLQVPGFPLYVSLSVSRSTILKRWWRDVMSYGITVVAGSLLLMIVSVYAVRRANATEAALVSLNIETERRLEAEQQLRITQRIEVVGQLAAGVAHQFNNLLAIILGNVDLSRRDHARTEEYSDRALRAGQRAAGLIGSLLVFAGKKHLDRQTANLNEIIHNLAPMIEETIGKGHRLTLALDPKIADCAIDVSEFGTALLNLTLNAKDAMAGGGMLTIKTQPSGEKVAVVVTDTGVGMDAELREKIFEPFFTTKLPGIGLGLSQVYGFVRQVGGDVTVTSEVGHGSTVTMCFPVISVNRKRDTTSGGGGVQRPTPP